MTEVRKKTGYSGFPHAWPTVYYRDLAQSGSNPELRKDASVGSRYPKGVMDRVTLN